VGTGASNAGTFNQTDGAINVTAITTQTSLSGSNTALLNLSGGTLASSGMVTFSSRGGPASGNGSTTVNISGTATLNANAGLRIGANSSYSSGATINQTGGIVNVTGGLNLARVPTNANTARGIYNLNAGTLSTNAISQDATVGTSVTSGTINFNGGTLKPTTDSTTFMQSLTTAAVQSGGAKIDTNDLNITVAQPLVSGTAGDGGLTKSGTGTLTLTGASNYNGPTAILAGKLALSGSLTSDVAVSGGILAAIGAPVTTGGVAIDSGGHFEVQINGVSPGTQYGQLNVGGGVSLNGALDINAAQGLAAGSTFTILNKTSAGAVSGIFAGKAEGSVFTASGYPWIISYAGGSGNDLVLTIATAQQAWRYQHFGTIANSGTAADTFDANGDGEQNLMEFATGQDPHAATLTRTTLVPNGATLEFTYTRANAALADGVIFTVQHSDTLAPGSWSGAGVTEQILSDNDTVQTVLASVAEGTGKRFLRLRVTR
jgi:fibronectin-binding autotransporter adhesin